MGPTFARAVGVMACALALCVVALGCGSGGSDATGSDSGSAGSTVPSAEFTKKGGNNQPATWGRVAAEDEREAASEVLEENFEARESGDWKTQCETLTVESRTRVEAYARGNCERGLEIEAEPLSSSKEARENTLTGPIDVLRVKGTVAYALYHGTKGKDQAMKMEKEGGDWKVARLATTEVP